MARIFVRSQHKQEPAATRVATGADSPDLVGRIQAYTAPPLDVPVARPLERAVAWHPKPAAPAD